MADYAEKGAFVNDHPATEGGSVDGSHMGKGGALAEAADLYGDIDTAEQYGYVQRGYLFLHLHPTCHHFLTMPPLVSSLDTFSSSLLVVPLELVFSLVLEVP
jgi:hypothetical protein